MKIAARDLGKTLSVVAVDPAASAGLAVAGLSAVPASRAGYLPRRGGPTSPRYELHVHTLSSRGHELERARSIVRACGNRLDVLLLEAQYIGVNEQTAIKVISARTRWAFAFEIACDEAGAAQPEVVLVQPPSWQAGWLGLASVHGRKAIKIASNLAAQRAVTSLGSGSTGPAGLVEGDEADALNILLWWLDHHLLGLPRKWARASER